MTLLRPDAPTPGELKIFSAKIGGPVLRRLRRRRLFRRGRTDPHRRYRPDRPAVTLPSSGFALPAYIAGPGARTLSGRVVGSEMFGLHEYIRDVCRRLAKLGYVAIAPAFFVRVGDPGPALRHGAVFKIVQAASDPQVLSDVGATLAYLKAQDFVAAAKVAVTGFCWGGGVTWLACETFSRFQGGRGLVWADGSADRRGDTPDRAMAGEVGRPSPRARPGPLRRPGPPGETDSGDARGARPRPARATTEIIVYPDAGHGFHADYRASYNATDAADGWRRMLAFFAANGVARRPYHARPEPRASAAQLAGRGVSRSRASCGSSPRRVLDAANGVQHGGVVPPAEPAADVGQGAGGELLGQPHRRLTRPGDRSRPALGDQVGLLQPEVLGRRLLDIVDGDPPLASAQVRAEEGARASSSVSAAEARRRRERSGCSAPPRARARCR